MKQKRYSVEDYYQAHGEYPFEKWTVILEAWDYQFFYDKQLDSMFITFKYNDWSSFNYRINETFSSLQWMQDTSDKYLTLYTLDDNGNCKKESVFCIRVTDIL